MGTSACCTDDDACSTGLPKTCSEGCANTIMPIMDVCGSYLRRSVADSGAIGQLVKLARKCAKTTAEVEDRCAAKCDDSDAKHTKICGESGITYDSACFVLC